MLDNTVRIVVILIVLVFDPLAILLVIAANQSLLQRRGEQISFVTIDNVEPEPEDFGIDPDIDGDGVSDLTDTEVEQFNRLDRSLRSKLSWLIDKKGKNDA